MNNKKNIKKPIWIITIALIILLFGVSLNILIERNPIMGEFTLPISTKQTFASFYKNVVPILDKNCSVCHGVDEEKFQNIKNSSQSSELLRWQIGVSGRIETHQLGRQLYDDLLKDIRGPVKNNLVEYDIHPIESNLLRAGLAKKYSGSSHHQILEIKRSEK